jgi:hypothetical protein
MIIEYLQGVDLSGCIFSPFKRVRIIDESSKHFGVEGDVLCIHSQWVFARWDDDGIMSNMFLVQCELFNP